MSLDSIQSTDAATRPSAETVAAAAARAQEGERWSIIDLDAQVGEKPREHQLMIGGRIQKLTFEAGAPYPLPPVVAVKLLASANFARVDEQTGAIMEWKNPPKQPDQLGAGERFELAPDQTVATYDELTVTALRVRAAQLPGGEALPGNASKDDVVAFIIKATAERKRQNTVEETNTTGMETFEPEPMFTD